MQKPIITKKKEFIQNLLFLINNSDLPYLVVEYMLQEFLRDFHTVVEQKNQCEESAYFEELQKQQAEQAKSEESPAEIEA